MSGEIMESIIKICDGRNKIKIGRDIVEKYEDIV